MGWKAFYVKMVINYGKLTQYNYIIHSDSLSCLISRRLILHKNCNALNYWLDFADFCRNIALKPLCTMLYPLENVMPPVVDKEYIKTVDRLAQDKSDFTFMSSDIRRASIVMAKLLEYSENIFRIYDRKVNGDIADKHEIFGLSLSKFLMQGKNLKIVLCESEFKDSDIRYRLESYSEMYPSQIDVRLAGQKFRENVKSLMYKDVNFCVNDQGGYRLEVEELKREAIICFNNTSVSDKLVYIFDYYFDNCSKINLNS